MKDWMSLRAAVLSILALALVACGPAATATPRPTVAPSPTAKPPGPTGELKVTTTEFSVETWDPAKAAFGSNSHVMQPPIFDSLVGVKPDASLAPGIAERWEMSPDGLSWTFYIRRNAKFHNGDAVTANDVKFSLDWYFRPESTATFAVTFRQEKATVAVLDDYTLRLATEKIDPYVPLLLSPLQANLGFVIPKNYISQQGWDSFLRSPVGSGPFKLTRHVRGDRVEYEALDSHWRKVPAFRKLTLMAVPAEATQVAMLKSGEADLIETSAERIPEIEAAGLKATKVPAVMQVAMPFQGSYMPGAGPVSDVRVRQALSLAINRQELLEFILKGAGSISLPVWQLYPFSADVNASDWQPYAYDPEKAKQLLKDAGYAQGLKVKMFNVPLGGAPWLTKMNEAVAGYWQKIGVSVELVAMDSGAFLPLVLGGPPKPQAVGAAFGHRSPTKYVVPPGFRTFFHSKGQWPLLNDPEMDKLIEQIEAAPDPAKRQALIRQAGVVIRDSYVAPTIVYADGVYGISKNIGTWQPVAGHSFSGIALETITRSGK